MNRAPGPFALDDAGAFLAWREHKLEDRPRHASELVVELRDPARLGTAERDALLDRCARWNMAVYAVAGAPPVDRDAVRALGAQLGLHRLDLNPLADDDGISPLACSDQPRRGEFIPYTDRAIRWHTDGYYNPPARAIRAMILHCVERAEQGGENRLLDHELAYLMLRDEDPAHVRALMAPDAMTIPARAEDGVEVRPDQGGPVFAVDAGGRLHMRYTARTRSIAWKDDPATRAALAALERVLDDNPYVLRLLLEPGMGVIANNVLHDRAAFSDGPGRRRLLWRARYLEHVAAPAPACA